MDKTTIFNLALSAMGTKNRIALPTETSVEARECALWYESVRQQVLCAAPFQEARATVRLALQAERDPDADWVTGDPDPGWQFAYAAPQDMLRPRNISTYDRFILSVSGSEKRIVTNTEDAILVYTFDQTNVDLWSVLLQNAVALALSSAICLKLGGKLDRSQLIAARANDLLMQARVMEGNIDDFQLESVPPWLSARGVDAMPSNRYFFPYGPLFVTDSVSVA